MITFEQLVARGEARGEARARVETLLRLLGRKFGEVSEGVGERVRGASVVELDRWIDQVLTATSVEDVLR